MRNSASTDQLLGFQTDWPSNFDGFILLKQTNYSKCLEQTHRNSILSFLKHLQNPKSLKDPLPHPLCRPSNRATKLSPSVESSRRPPALHCGPANPLAGLGKHGENDKRQTTNVVICCVSNNVLKKSFFIYLDAWKRLFWTNCIVRSEAPVYDSYRVLTRITCLTFGFIGG